MKTLKLRIKDKHYKVLDQLALEVNFVWNYVNDLGFKHLKRKGEFLSAYDIAKYTKGTSGKRRLTASRTVRPPMPESKIPTAMCALALPGFVFCLEFVPYII